MLLELKDVAVHYERVAALKGISVTVEDGALVTFLGANGAGKSTALRAISGLKKPSSGEIWFNGQRIDGRSANAVVGLGISHVPEGRRVFPYMSVFENLKMGAFLRRDREQVAKDYETVYSHFPRLEERNKQAGSTLSGGEQQMLAIGRALMSRPKLLLMDEPSLGLSPIMCKEIAKIIAEIRQRHGIGVLLVEQNARLALRLADHAYVLVTGSIVLQGTGQELLMNDEVKKAYLGM
jgi:branched-chain amino acid transport system ATP-binding protein